MPDFTFTSPEGKSYTVTGPEGATKEQAFSILQQSGKTTEAAAPPADRSTLGDVAIEGGKGLLRGAVSFAGDIGEAVMGPFGPSKHFANLKADITGAERPKPDPTYGTQISQAAGIEPAPQTRAGKFASTTGEVVGNPASYLGPGSALVKGGAAVLSGVGSEAAGQAAEGFKSPGLEAGARFVGGLAGAGGAIASAERNLTKLAEQLPTRETIKSTAGQLYDSLKTSNVRISPPGMDDLLQTIKTDLHNDHFREFAQPITYRTIEELATSGGNIGGIDAVRQVLGRNKTVPSERDASNRAIKAIDDFLVNVDPRFVVSGNPAKDAATLKEAQGLWAAHKQLEMIEDASIAGQHRAGVSGSGANRINTARQEIRKILDSDKKSRGMSDSAKAKMEEIVMGTWLTNKSRQIGKFAPSGPVSATTSILTGMGAGPGAGAAVAAGGFLAKHLGEYLTDKQLRELEQIIRSESPIGKPAAAAIAPQVREQQAVPAAAATRAALTSPLAAGGP
jgi:hypothetical protein